MNIQEDIDISCNIYYISYRKICKKKRGKYCNGLSYNYTLLTTAYRQHPRFISRVGNMAKFNSTEEIERKYNQKIGNVKKRRTEALRNFAN